MKPRWRPSARGHGFGGGVQHECMIQAAILAVIAAVAIPQLIALRVKGQDQACLQALAAHARGAPSDARCPHDDQPYVWKQVAAPAGGAGGAAPAVDPDEAEESLSCPATEAVLPTGPRVIRRGEELRLQQVVPPLASPPSARPLPVRDSPLEVWRTDDALVVATRAGGFLRYVLAPLLVLVPVTWAGLTVRQDWDPEEDLRKRLLAAGGCLLPLLLASLLFAGLLLREEVVRFQAGGRITTHTELYGVALTRPSPLPPVARISAVRETRDSDRAVVVALEEGEEPVVHELFSAPRAALGLLAHLPAAGEVRVAAAPGE